MEFNLETENLYIRQFEASDAKAAAFYSQQPSVAYWMSDMILHNEAEALEWIEWINKMYNTSKPFMILSIENKADNKSIGVVGVHPKEEIDNEVEILYGISDEYQGKGYATEASRVLINWVFANTQLQYLTAIVKPENVASRIVIEKLDFKKVDERVVPYDGEMCRFDYYRLER